MSESGTAASSTDGAEVPPYVLTAEDVVAATSSDAASGLTGAEAASRLTAYGPNEIAAEKPPSVWAIAASQLRDPMNIMLVAVVVVSLLIESSRPESSWHCSSCSISDWAPDRS